MADRILVVERADLVSQRLLRTWTKSQRMLLVALARCRQSTKVKYKAGKFL